MIGTEHLPEGAAVLAEEPAARWFMDYRNGDGVGRRDVRQRRPGVRGVPRAARPVGRGGRASSAVGTRAGVKRVRRVPVPAGIGDDVWYAVDMGRWFLPGGDDGRRRPVSTPR